MTDSTKQDSQTPKLTVVPIRGGAPALNDIPGMLEQLAKDMRAGKPSYQRVLVVGEDDDGDAIVHGFGQLRTLFHDIGMLDEAKEYLRACETFVADVPPKSEG